jgi:RNA recognition motif-containing protein
LNQKIKKQIAEDKYMIIFAGNLSYSVTDIDLKDIFSEFGQVSKIQLFVDNFMRQCTGYGVVEMPNNTEAEMAISALDGSSFCGREIKLHQY